MGDKPEDAVHATDNLPRHTTPTWEVELLISGVAVFAMLQLPGWLDTQYFLLVPRFAAEWRSALSIVHMYLTSAAIILAVTFFLHLLLRARWIALVGMQSVYPTGIRWDRLRMGPLRRSVEQVQSGTSADAVERADNQASILFAVGVSLASMMLLLGLVAALVCGVSISLALALGLPIDPAMMFLAVFAVIMAPLFWPRSLITAGAIKWQWTGARGACCRPYSAATPGCMWGGNHTQCCCCPVTGAKGASPCSSPGWFWLPS